MKALLLEKYNQLVYTDVPEPEITSDEVLVPVKFPLKNEPGLDGRQYLMTGKATNQ